VVHFIILGIVLVILVLSGFYPSWYWFQILYYLFAQTMLVIGVSWFTASILPFFPDITHIISITMRVLFFTTPIFWSFDTMSPLFAKILSLNPLVYTVSGYRDSLVYHIPFWHHLNQTLYFWGVVIFFGVLGVSVFKRLRPHFADVI
jgi:ABC-type polysaccharide/polyol phosphate export permease